MSLIGLVYSRQNDPNNLSDYKNIINIINNNKLKSKPLLIYNENYKQWSNKNDLQASGGNAFLRKYRSDNLENKEKYNFYVLSIPTNDKYDKSVIKIIINFIHENNIKTVIWCIDNNKYELGLSIFKNYEDAQYNVKKYTKKLLKKLKDQFKFYYYSFDNKVMFNNKYEINPINNKQFIQFLEN